MADTKAVLETKFGNITLKFFPDVAPGHVKNFVDLATKGFYDNTTFHRVIPGFMIQGGGFDASLNKPPADQPIRLEIIPGLRHEPGIVSMARTTDPHSATSQFFVCVAEAAQLNGGYAAFGKVEQGYDVVLAIANVETKTVETGPTPMTDVPSTPVVIESISRAAAQR